MFLYGLPATITSYAIELWPFDALCQQVTPREATRRVGAVFSRGQVLFYPTDQVRSCCSRRLMVDCALTYEPMPWHLQPLRLVQKEFMIGGKRDLLHSQSRKEFRARTRMIETMSVNIHTTSWKRYRMLRQESKPAYRSSVGRCHYRR